ncbi:hypothetical protein GCM10009430_12040 [Aquimarina litoralis]|uniref:Uncharacterized protein n=1 Tax=Aquimarina litoralis TaxID=584605 RepID=A0ABP3TVJ2_9FLAO
MWLPKNLGIDNLLIEKSEGSITREDLNQLHKYDFKLAEMQGDDVVGIANNRNLLNRVDRVLQTITKEELRQLFYKQETTKAGKVFRSLRKRTLTDEETIDAINVDRHREHLSESIRSLDQEIKQKERVIPQDNEALTKHENDIKDKESKKAQLIAEHNLSDDQLKVLLQERLRNNPKPWDDRTAINNADKKRKDRDKKHSSNIGRLGLNTGMGVGTIIGALTAGESATAAAVITAASIGAAFGGIFGMLVVAIPLSYWLVRDYIPRSKARRQAKSVKELIKERTKRESRQRELDHEIGALRNDHENHLAIQQMKEYGVLPPPPPLELEQGMGTRQNNINETLLLTKEQIRSFINVNRGEKTTNKKQKKPEGYKPGRRHKPIKFG